jgi:NADH dehydrogenase (ubiquinone) 1 alpha subcomplex subunit 2|tara:strand:+ start:293 stop:469 length:177 start_codon:yes stop_codon:yes gene_type:complete
LNPSTPILIREHPGEEARLIASYGFGVERRVVVDNMDEAGVEKELKKLVAAGDYMKKA